MEEVSEDAKPQGALHHRFLAGDGELLVVDEWETAEGFQKFFEGNEKIAKVTAEAGVTGPPDVSVFSPVEAPGTF
jgi:heme-degrading monooxygenase HmoA